MPAARAVGVLVDEAFLYDAWNGKPTRVYHYVATLEYPYTLGCFHGAPISSGRAVGGGVDPPRPPPSGGP